MDRRRFLTQSGALVAASFNVVGCRDDVTSERIAAPPPLPPVLVSFPPMTFVTCDPTFNDYRPAADPTGTMVVFERTPFPNPGNKADTTLYVAKLGGTGCAAAVPLLPVFSPLPAGWPSAQTRPDWSVANGQIAFSGAPSNMGTNQVYVVAGNGTSLTLVPKTVAHIYPIWASNGSQLIAYNDSTSAAPVKPVTALIDAITGDPAVKNLNGNDASGVAVFGGFAAPQPSNPTRIAFAGQPALASWGLSTPPPSGTNPVYNQDNNYVFLNTSSNGTYTSAPLEPAASIATFDPAYQGRAPYWSPNGQYIVFESSRAGGYALFLANVANAAQGAAPVQLTDATCWAQHAKFLPGGKQLVFTALQTPSATSGAGARGIAIIDISSYVT